MYNLQLTELETRTLRAAFQLYQQTKRREASHNKDSEKVKSYALLLGAIESLQEKIGYPEDRK